MKETAKEKELKHQARRKSIKEGIFAAAKSSFGDRFIQPFAIAINSSSSNVALLSSISGILGPLSQLFSSNFFENKPRKKIVLKTVLMEALMWIPFLIIALLFFKGLYIGVLPTLLLLAFSFYILFGNLAVPHWFSWMGDIVDKEYRGRWFSKRDLILGFVTVVLATASSFFLDYLKKSNLEMIGFSILFGLALTSRLISWTVFKKQYEPKLKFEKRDHFTFIEFLKKSHKNNFGKFTLFRTLFVFAGSIFASLLSVYLLRNLGFSYSVYMVITLSEVLFSLAIMNFWGRFADKFGNYKVMLICAFAIPFIPILWLLNPSPIYLVFVPALVSGIVWPGFRLATGNFVYDNISKEKRSLAVSYYNMMLGIGIFLGGLVSAVLIKFTEIIYLESIIFIFILSTVIRFLVVIWWIPKIKEVRKTKKLNTKDFEKNLIKGIKPTIIEEMHEISSIRNYLKD